MEYSSLKFSLINGNIYNKIRFQNPMNLGLTGGIAVGKTKYEDAFRRKGYAVFDTDDADHILRTGELDIFRHGSILLNHDLVSLVGDLSKEVISELRERLAHSYDVNGNFSRAGHRLDVTDKVHGAENLAAYRNVINSASVEFYMAWRDLIDRPSVLSSGVLIERENLELVDHLYMVYNSPDAQVRNLMRRQRERGSPISEGEAQKAIARQWSFDKKLEVAMTQIGSENITILESGKRKSNEFLDC